MDTEKSAPYGALLFWQDNALFGHPVAFYRAGKIGEDGNHTDFNRHRPINVA